MPTPPPSVYVGDPRVRNAREQMALNRLRQWIWHVVQDIPERMTTVERLALPDPDNHRFVWDLTLQEMYYWDGAWFLVGPGGSSLDEMVKISATDTVTGFLGVKLVGGANVLLSVLNPGANEQLQINAVGGGGSVGLYIDGGGVVVSDLVALSAPDTVVPADSTTNAAQAVGFAVSVIAGVVTVLYIGELNTFVGLTPGAEYWASPVPGTIVTPAPVSGSGEIRRRVGIAKNPTTLAVGIDPTWLQLA